MAHGEHPGRGTKEHNSGIVKTTRFSFIPVESGLSGHFNALGRIRTELDVCSQNRDASCLMKTIIINSILLIGAIALFTVQAQDTEKPAPPEEKARPKWQHLGLERDAAKPFSDADFARKINKLGDHGIWLNILGGMEYTALIGLTYNRYILSVLCMFYIQLNHYYLMNLNS